MFDVVRKGRDSRMRDVPPRLGLPNSKGRTALPQNALELLAKPQNALDLLAKRRKERESQPRILPVPLP